MCGALPFDAPNLPLLRDRVLTGRFRIPFFMSTGKNNIYRYITPKDAHLSMPHLHLIIVFINLMHCVISIQRSDQFFKLVPFQCLHTSINISLFRKTTNYAITNRCTYWFFDISLQTVNTSSDACLSLTRKNVTKRIRSRNIAG